MAGEQHMLIPLTSNFCAVFIAHLVCFLCCGICFVLPRSMSCGFKQRGLCWSFCHIIMFLYVLSSVQLCPLRIPHKNDVLFGFYPVSQQENLRLIVLFMFISIQLCPTHATDPMCQNGDCQTMRVLLNSFACSEQSDWPK